MYFKMMTPSKEVSRVASIYGPVSCKSMTKRCSGNASLKGVPTTFEKKITFDDFFFFLHMV